jgi:antitoxin CptB
MATDAEFRKICWQSRRGMRELDVLLIPFCEDGFRQLSEPDQRTYVRLLHSDDPQLLRWFTGQSTPDDPELARVIKLIAARMRR